MTYSPQKKLMYLERPKKDAGPRAGIMLVKATAANLQVLAGMLEDRGPAGRRPLFFSRKSRRPV
ncbi:MAG TPA: hypothetical protein VGP68_01860 [Gemmataceae bacterium]|nr:hypothetical protein [Gemmataceae bacterium]